MRISSGQLLKSSNYIICKTFLRDDKILDSAVQNIKDAIIKS